MSASGSEWAQHLRTRLAAEKDGYTFDMDDILERPHAAEFAKLHDALSFLDTTVSKPYHDADSNAIRHQKWHRRLAAVAIVGGGLAVILAIVQLAMPHGGSQSGVTFLEWFAAGAGAVAVSFGIIAKRNHQWFIQRHVAERLRMLKFRSLGMRELWCGDTDSWKKAVRTDLAKITSLLAQNQGTSMKRVEAWSESDTADSAEPAIAQCIESEEGTRAIAEYYRAKRVDFQAFYFAKQSTRFQKRVSYIQHAGLPLFFTSIAMVIIHSVAHHYHAPEVSLLALTLAAGIPVVSFALRAWISAFEHTRSASLFQAKSRALTSISGAVARDATSVAGTMHHIAQVEHFLEHEHREWLRLMLDAEWFL